MGVQLWNGVWIRIQANGLPNEPIAGFLFSQSNSKNKGVHAVETEMGHLSPILPQSFQTGGVVNWMCMVS